LNELFSRAAGGGMTRRTARGGRRSASGECVQNGLLPEAGCVDAATARSEAADLEGTTAREGWGDPRARGARGQRSLRPSQRGPDAGAGGGSVNTTGFRN